MNSTQLGQTTANAVEESIIQWKAEKIAEKFHAKWHAGEATDADVAEYHNRFNIAKGCEEVEVVEVVAEVEVVEVVAEVEVVEVVSAEVTIAQTAAEVTATLDTSEAFGTAWGADGQVLSYDETAEAIAKRDGWFDREGRWVNKAGWEKEHSGLGAWLTAKLAE